MKRRELIALGVVALAALSLVPLELMAETTADFGGAGFTEEAKKIQGFLFGPTMRLAGVMGGAYGLITAIMSSSVRPLMVYGGIGMGVNLMPKFIDGVFSTSGMLISMIGG